MNRVPHKPTGERCDNCRFWLRDPKSKDTPMEKEEGSSDFGLCRRKPPVYIDALVKMHIQPPRYGDQVEPEEALKISSAYDATAFPGTYGTEWCGEYQPSNREVPIC